MNELHFHLLTALQRDYLLELGQRHGILWSQSLSCDIIKWDAFRLPFRAGVELQIFPESPDPLPNPLQKKPRVVALIPAMFPPFEFLIKVVVIQRILIRVDAMVTAFNLVQCLFSFFQNVYPGQKAGASMQQKPSPKEERFRKQSGYKVRAVSSQRPSFSNRTA